MIVIRNGFASRKLWAPKPILAVTAGYLHLSLLIPMRDYYSHIYTLSVRNWPLVQYSFVYRAWFPCGIFFACNKIIGGTSTQPESPDNW
jgi:hypothetical protein